MEGAKVDLFVSGSSKKELFVMTPGTGPDDSGVTRRLLVYRADLGKSTICKTLQSDGSHENQHKRVFISAQKMLHKQQQRPKLPTVALT